MESEDVAAGVSAVFAVLTTIWGIWAIVVAFRGGTVPLLGWELEGSFSTGMVWALFVVPIFELIAYWLSLLVAIPLGLLLGKSGDR